MAHSTDTDELRTRIRRVSERVRSVVRIRMVAVALSGLASLVLLAACGDDSGDSSSSGPGSGSTAAANDTTDGASGSGASGSGGSETTSGAPTTEGTTTTTNPVVPDAQATSGLVQTAVQMRFLAASVQAGEATDAAFQGVFDGWDVYDGTIQKNDPAAWQTMTEVLIAMQLAVTAKDAAAAEAASAKFEAVSNGYLGSH